MSIPCTCRVSPLSEFTDVEQDHSFENMYINVPCTCRVSHQCEYVDVGQDTLLRTCI